MKIEQTSDPKTEDINFLKHNLARESSDYGDIKSFGFFVRDEKGIIIAGCSGSLYAGTIFTANLWVHQDYRQAGWGKKLMERVCDYGREQGCITAFLSTMSFQSARPFYEKIGFTVEYERDGYMNGATCLLLRKSL